MTGEEILNMPAGIEMDALIFEYVLGAKWYNRNGRNFLVLPEDIENPSLWKSGKTQTTSYPYIGGKRYSQSIVDAWEVFMWLFARGIVHLSNGDGDSFDITFSPTKNKDAMHTIKSDLRACLVVDDNFPRLVCRAALLSVMEAE